MPPSQQKDRKAKASGLPRGLCTPMTANGRLALWHNCWPPGFKVRFLRAQAATGLHILPDPASLTFSPENSLQ